MIKYMIMFLLIAHVAWAADGAPVSPEIPTGKSPVGSPSFCMKICDGKTSATDCGPAFVPGPICHAVIKVTAAVNGGSAATFDDWGVYEQRTSTTPSATTLFGALCAIDDDTTTSVVGATAAAECKIFGPMLPWLFIDAGTLGTTTNFTVEACFWDKCSN